MEVRASYPRRLSSNLNPLYDPVEARERPEDYRALLSETDFADRPWNIYFGSDRFFYLAGVTDAMRLLQEHTASFLKLRGYLDEVLGDSDLERWSFQCGIPLNQPIKRERAKEISIPAPTYFYKCVEALVAFELAIAASDRLDGRVSPFWVYDYMRIVPAVYNIRGLNHTKLESLRENYDNFDRLALEATGQTDAELLDDLANGKTVTRPTAVRLKYFIDKHCTKSAYDAVAEVRDRPGRHGLGQGPASQCENIREIF